jgi:hypothetical protein
MTRVQRLGAVFVMAGSVAACGFGSGNSYVDRLETPADAKVLAGAMADFVARRLPAGATTLLLGPTPSEESANALTPALVAAFRDRGFALADAGQAGAPGTHRIRYFVTRLDNGDLLRVTIDGGAAEAARFFVRNSAGGLQAGGPFTVRQIAEVK